jgi:hypothetical protein
VTPLGPDRLLPSLRSRLPDTCDRWQADYALRPALQTLCRPVHRSDSVAREWKLARQEGRASLARLRPRRAGLLASAALDGAGASPRHRHSRESRAPGSADLARAGVQPGRTKMNGGQHGSRISRACLVIYLTCSSPPPRGTWHRIEQRSVVWNRAVECVRYWCAGQQ